MTAQALDDLPTQRVGPELIARTRPFAQEQLPRSVRYALTTLGVLAMLQAAVVLITFWPLRLVLSVVFGLTIVRGFIIYHDIMHSAMFRGRGALPRVFRAVFKVYGLWVMTPPTIWRESHNYHHAHTSKLVGSSIGSYPIVTTGMWARMKRAQRFAYRAIRHPLTILFGYFTIFLFGMCVAPALRHPRKYWDCWVALALQGALSVLFWKLLGPSGYFFAHLLPLAVSMASGSYLFYAQHNFPGMQLASRESWSYTKAALESSSYMKTGPLMGWFTGNIGYHHVHHMNSAIPFYRLPEAMAEVPELQHPLGVTSLSPREIWRCLKLSIWDPSAHEMRSSY